MEQTIVLTRFQKFLTKVYLGFLVCFIVIFLTSFLFTTASPDTVTEWIGWIGAGISPVFLLLLIQLTVVISIFIWIKNIKFFSGKSLLALPFFAYFLFLMLINGYFISSPIVAYLNSGILHTAKYINSELVHHTSPWLYVIAFSFYIINSIAVTILPISAIRVFSTSKAKFLGLGIASILFFYGFVIILGFLQPGSEQIFVWYPHDPYKQYVIPCVVDIDNDSTNGCQTPKTKLPNGEFDNFLAISKDQELFSRFDENQSSLIIDLYNHSTKDDREIARIPIEESSEASKYPQLVFMDKQYVYFSLIITPKSSFWESYCSELPTDVYGLLPCTERSKDYLWGTTYWKIDKTTGQTTRMEGQPAFLVNHGSYCHKDVDFDYSNGCQTVSSISTPLGEYRYLEPAENNPDGLVYLFDDTTKYLRIGVYDKSLNSVKEIFKVNFSMGDNYKPTQLMIYKTDSDFIYFQMRASGTFYWTTYQMALLGKDEISCPQDCGDGNVHWKFDRKTRAISFAEKLADPTKLGGFDYNK
jgi:hypothetical protein